MLVRRPFPKHTDTTLSSSSRTASRGQDVPWRLDVDAVFDEQIDYLLVAGQTRRVQWSTLSSTLLTDYPCVSAYLASPATDNELGAERDDEEALTELIAAPSREPAARAQEERASGSVFAPCFSWR